MNAGEPAERKTAAECLAFFPRNTDIMVAGCPGNPLFGPNPPRGHLWIPLKVNPEWKPKDLRQHIQSCLETKENVKVDFNALSEIITASEPHATTLRRLLGLPDEQKIKVDPSFHLDHHPTRDKWLLVIVCGPPWTAAAALALCGW